MHRNPRTFAERIAIQEAEQEVKDSGYTVEPLYSYIEFIPGVGARAFSFSFETLPNTNGHPACEAIATVREEA